MSECLACDKPATKGGYCAGHQWLTYPGADRLMEVFAESEVRRVGTARHVTWHAEDGWLIVYTTEKVRGGPNPGKYEVLAYKPVGKGARGGRRTAREWEQVYRRPFAKRKTAKARALALYRQHSPKWNEKHPEPVAS